MSTLLHILPREMLSLLFGFTTDYFVQSELEKILPEYIQLIRNSVHIILSVPESHNIDIESLSRYPNLERVEPLLHLNTHRDMETIISHPNLRIFQLSFSTSPKKERFRDIYDFVYYYTSKRAIPEKSFIRLRYYNKDPDVILFGKHTYLSRKYQGHSRTQSSRFSCKKLSTIFECARSEFFWCDRLFLFPSSPRISQAHLIIGLEDIISPAHALSRCCIGVENICHFIGPIEKFQELLKSLSGKLQKNTFFWRVPILFSKGLRRILKKQNFSVYEVIVTEPSQMESVPEIEGKKIKLYRLPGSQPFGDLPVYSIYSSVEECMRAYI